MARLQVAGGEDGLQKWRIEADILKKQNQTNRAMSLLVSGEYTDWDRNYLDYYYYYYYYYWSTRWRSWLRTALQAGRSRVRFPMVSMELVY